ncbi:MAG: DNA-binding response regulator [Planctomycetaceae bacterium]|nr:MAG: DNA-binding response regulator [Planctomycetaceae bacterium]
MHILVVEDEAKLASYIKRGLEEEGYAVDVVQSGQQALDWIETVPFDVIVLDVLLPEMDGFAVCRKLRQRDIRTPVLMLTALDAVDDRVTGLDAGADDYLTKPFAFKELLARLRALSRRTLDQPRTNTLQVADLTLDTHSRQVHRAGVTIDLTAKEFAVLECLMREKGQVLSRSQIADHVWDYDAAHQSNVVDVYIRNLRRKVDSPFSANLIHTVRGAGYQITEDDENA